MNEQQPAQGYNIAGKPPGPPGFPAVEKGFAAVFIDYENVYYHLMNRYADIPELSDFVVDLLISLQKHLEEHFNVRSIISKAYADYERLKSTPQGSLYLMGVETVNVLGTDHKNAADMMLCIDAMQVMYTRPEINSFVLFAGDRDYIPLIQHLKKQAKTVVSVGFEGSFSGDLMMNVGRANFIDANDLFSTERLAKLEETAKRYHDYIKAEEERARQRSKELLARSEEGVDSIEKQKEAYEAQLKPMSDAADDSSESGPGDASEGKGIPVVEFDPENPSKIVDSMLPVTSKRASGKLQAATPKDGKESFNSPITDLDDDERTCLGLMVKYFGNYHDIYLSPFLRKLSDALPSLADWERKSILSDLEFKGAVRMEKRSGIPHDYTVVILNYNHPTVREMC